MSHTTSPPRIRIYDSASRHGRLSLPRRAPPAQHCSTSSAVPMPIPHARGESPPPPLPPPRHIIGLDAAPELSSSSWHVGSPRHDPGAASLSGPVSTAAAALRSGLSLLNGNGNGAGAGAGPTRASNTGSGDDTDSLDIRSSRRHSSSATTHTIDTDLNYEVDMSDDERPGPKRPTGANRRLHSECQLGQRTLDHHSNAYDKQLLAKIGGPKPLGLGPRPPPRAGSGSSTSGGTFLSPTPQDTIPAGARSPRDRLGELKPLSMPDKRHGSMDAGNSSARWTSAPSSGVSSGLSSGVSPGNSSMFRSPFEPASSAASEYSWRRHNSASTPDASTVDDSARSKRGSEDHGVFMDHDFAMDNENGMRELHLGERGGIMTGGDDYQLGSGAPLKRRAPSPPGEPTREDRSSVGNDVYHRRSAQMLNSRSSPVSRYQSVHGSVSSASSAGPKTNSLASSNMSNMSWNHSMASSMTSYGERLSPSALSPAVDVGAEYGAGPVSPYAASRSLNPSPRSSVSRPPHHRASTTTFPDHDSPQSRSVPADAAKMQGHYICECCPKKPKKFESAQELRAHEQEKQYQCQYCPNRFKNKNEAERHQNSLHLRRHSWSCAALRGVRAAFHPSGNPTTTTTTPTGSPSSATDACGYCGEEFPNGAGLDWDARAEHLNHVHKFGECNQAKKFFRADHFRQHLKHSHAGASGKWTNMLEMACMKDEPPPVPIMQQAQAQSQSQRPQAQAQAQAQTRTAQQQQQERIAGGAMGVLLPPTGQQQQQQGTAIPDVINEVHNES